MTRHLKIQKPIEVIMKIYNVALHDAERAKKLKALGKGAFGKVYLAYNQKMTQIF